MDTDKTKTNRVRPLGMLNDFVSSWKKTTSRKKRGMICFNVRRRRCSDGYEPARTRGYWHYARWRRPKRKPRAERARPAG